VPTLAEAGNLPGFDAELWIAAIAPKDMPQAFADRLTVEINTILKSPEARQKLFGQGWQAAGTSPEGLRSRMASDTKVWAEVIKRAGVKID
jgi:tripartite-type tricarboxylate transporter receptor subunit TctC